MKLGELSSYKDVQDMDETELQSAYEVCAETRALFPGFCALNFRKILHVIICYVLGWNNYTKLAGNGAFVCCS